MLNVFKAVQIKSTISRDDCTILLQYAREVFPNNIYPNMKLFVSKLKEKEFEYYHAPQLKPNFSWISGAMIEHTPIFSEMTPKCQTAIKRLIQSFIPVWKQLVRDFL